MFTVEVEQDYDPERPGTEDGDLFRLVSFSTRHIGFQHPDEIDEGSVLFPLSYFEHGLCRWSLSGEGSNDPWDSVRFAGVLLPGPYMESDPDYWAGLSDDEKRTAARAFCDRYTDWANGSCYYIRVLMDGHEIDGCGGLIGHDEVTALVADILAAYPTLTGEAPPVKWEGTYGYEFA